MKMEAVIRSKTPFTIYIRHCLTSQKTGNLTKMFRATTVHSSSCNF